MRRANLDQADLCQAVKPGGANALKSAAYYSKYMSVIFNDVLLVVRAYKATILLLEAHPRENAVKSTHDSTSIFLRPYMSLNLEITIANP